ncbi:UTRA domain-containing protein [Streptomyces sp. MspMP-M5]|uniref:UTRA domain-containing protein n=1 Tax=unclassified Streptomyces TaxID=2593676 RepID=UPI001319CE6C|nr:UTRA domain-containing protein [Streptomyces sp. MspMP-M5]MYT31285.1 UTRA domain-containing protein [Streptomyces sp. SID8354]
MGRRRGTTVRARSVKQRLTHSRQAFRDKRGYYFDPTAQPWNPLEPPTTTWGPAPRDVAALLSIPGQDDLVRDRIMGDAAAGKPMQLATSFLPAAVARGTQLAEHDTGPAGVYDLLEDMGHGPLAWEETVAARMPAPTEAERLRLSKCIPLLRTVFGTIKAPDGTVLEVNDTRMSVDAFEIGYPITRHPSAEPPVEPTRSLSALDARRGTPCAIRRWWCWWPCGRPRARSAPWRATPG